MVLETPLETAVKDPQAFETAVETFVEDLQPVQDLGGLQDQLNTFILGQQSIETVRKTKREAKAFETWLDGQREAEGLPMAKIDPKQLNISLGSFSTRGRKMAKSMSQAAWLERIQVLKDFWNCHLTLSL